MIITKKEKAEAMRDEDGRACPPPPMPSVSDEDKDNSGFAGLIPGIINFVGSYYDPLLAYTIELALYVKRLDKRITELEKGKHE